MGWEALPTKDDFYDKEDHNIPMGVWERVKTALTIVCMTMLGLGLGCLFLFVRWVSGMEGLVH